MSPRSLTHAGFAVACDPSYTGVCEARRVEFEGFFDPAIKPQIGDDLLQGLVSTVRGELVGGKSVY